MSAHPVIERVPRQGPAGWVRWLDPAEQRLRHVDGREGARAKSREQVDGGEPGDLFGHVQAPPRAIVKIARENHGDLGTLSPRF
jgi:hypothetical protein